MHAMFLFAAASVFLLAASVIADPLTTITPCAPYQSGFSREPITVTSQYQTVSTCSPTTTCARDGLCRTSYSYETFRYVSTVIPCDFNGSAGSTTTITKTDQPVTVSKFRTTVTSFFTPGHRRHAKPTPIYSTIGQDYVLPYDRLGPLAIPGYEGSGLCTDCGEDRHGVRHQPLAVTECTAGSAGTKCVEYTKTLVSSSAPAATSTSAMIVSTMFHALSAGTYTFAWPHSVPARTITANGHTFTLGPQIFNVFATPFFGHAGPFNFRTTVTATITQTVPASTQPATETYSAPVPPLWDHGSSSSFSIPSFADPWGKNSYTIPSPSHPSWPEISSSSSSSSASSWPKPSSVSSSVDPSPWLDWTSSSSPSSTSSASITSSVPRSTPSIITPASSSTTSTTSLSLTITTPSYSYPITSSSSLTTSSTTPAPSLGNIPPSVGLIYITVNIANARYRKRAAEYVSFGSGEDAVLVNEISDASIFKMYEGDLIDTSNGDYVGTDATSGSAALEEFADAASVFDRWTQSGGVLGYGAATFCYTPDNQIFMVFPDGTAPAGCMTCILGTAPVTWTTTTTSTTSTTTSSGPQNSSTLSERELESQEKEVEQPEGIEKRAVKKRHGLLHKY